MLRAPRVLEASFCLGTPSQDAPNRDYAFCAAVKKSCTACTALGKPGSILACAWGLHSIERVGMDEGVGHWWPIGQHLYEH